MHDSGAYDGKLLCVPLADPRQKAISSIKQIAPNQLEDVAEFFRTYKSLEGRVIVIDGWRDSDAVDDLLESCIVAEKANLTRRLCGGLRLRGRHSLLSSLHQIVWLDSVR